MDQLLTPGEFEALMQPTGAPEGKQARSIDLIARDHQAFALLPDLQAAADEWSGAVGRLLTQTFRQSCDPLSEPVEIVPAAQAQDLAGMQRFSFPLVSDVGAINVEDLLGTAFVIRQFGGSLQDLIIPEGQPSPTERRTVARLAETLFGLFVDAFKPVCVVSAKVSTSPPALPAGVGVVLVTTRLQLAEQRTSVSVALSTGSVRFRAGRARRAGMGQRSAQMVAEVARVPITVSSVLGGCDITMSRLLGLKPGDVLKLDTPVDGEIPLLVEGRLKFVGVPVRQRGNLSLEVRSRHKE